MAEVKVVFEPQAYETLILSPTGDVAKTLLRVAARIENQAKQLCAVDTGRLRSSIETEIGVDEDGLVARIGTNVVYAPFLEFGTSRMSARPFLRPALGAGAGEV